MSKQTKKSLFDTEISGELFAAESFEVVNKDKVAADADGVVTITASDAIVDGSQSKAAVYGEGQELVVHGYAGAGSVASVAAIELDKDTAAQSDLTVAVDTGLTAKIVAAAKVNFSKEDKKATIADPAATNTVEIDGTRVSIFNAKVADAFAGAVMTDTASSKKYKLDVQAIVKNANIEINGGTVTNVYAGGSGLTSITENANIYLASGKVTNVYAGGADGAKVIGDVSIYAEMNNLTIGTIYAGGKNANVFGDVEITLTTNGPLGGTGKINKIIGGTASKGVTTGSQTLVFDAYHGEFAATVQNIDTVTITDDSAVIFTKGQHKSMRTAEYRIEISEANNGNQGAILTLKSAYQLNELTIAIDGALLGEGSFSRAVVQGVKSSFNSSKFDASRVVIETEDGLIADYQYDLSFEVDAKGKDTGKLVFTYTGAELVLGADGYITKQGAKNSLTSANDFVRFEFDYDKVFANYDREIAYDFATNAGNDTVTIADGTFFTGKLSLGAGNDKLTINGTLSYLDLSGAGENVVIVNGKLDGRGITVSDDSVNNIVINGSIGDTKIEYQDDNFVAVNRYYFYYEDGSCTMDEIKKGKKVMRIEYAQIDANGNLVEGSIPVGINDPVEIDRIIKDFDQNDIGGANANAQNITLLKGSNSIFVNSVNVGNIKLGGKYAQVVIGAAYDKAIDLRNAAESDLVIDTAGAFAGSFLGSRIGENNVAITVAGVSVATADQLDLLYVGTNVSIADAADLTVADWNKEAIITKMEQGKLTLGQNASISGAGVKVYGDYSGYINAPADLIVFGTLSNSVVDFSGAELEINAVEASEINLTAGEADFGTIADSVIFIDGAAEVAFNGDVTASDIIVENIVTLEFDDVAVDANILFENDVVATINVEGNVTFTGAMDLANGAYTFNFFDANVAFENVISTGAFNGVHFEDAAIDMNIVESNVALNADLAVDNLTIAGESSISGAKINVANNLTVNDFNGELSSSIAFAEDATVEFNNSNITAANITAASVALNAAAIANATIAADVTADNAVISASTITGDVDVTDAVISASAITGDVIATDVVLSDVAVDGNIVANGETSFNNVSAAELDAAKVIVAGHNVFDKITSNIIFEGEGSVAVDEAQDIEAYGVSLGVAKAGYVTIEEASINGGEVANLDITDGTAHLETVTNDLTATDAFVDVDEVKGNAEIIRGGAALGNVGADLTVTDANVTAGNVAGNVNVDAVEADAVVTVGDVEGSATVNAAEDFAVDFTAGNIADGMIITANGDITLDVDSVTGDVELYGKNVVLAEELEVIDGNLDLTGVESLTGDVRVYGYANPADKLDPYGIKVNNITLDGKFEADITATNGDNTITLKDGTAIVRENADLFNKVPYGTLDFAAGDDTLKIEGSASAKLVKADGDLEVLGGTMNAEFNVTGELNLGEAGVEEDYVTKEEDVKDPINAAIVGAVTAGSIVVDAKADITGAVKSGDVTVNNFADLTVNGDANVGNIELAGFVAQDEITGERAQDAAKATFNGNVTAGDITLGNAAAFTAAGNVAAGDIAIAEAAVAAIAGNVQAGAINVAGTLDAEKDVAAASLTVVESGKADIEGNVTVAAGANISGLTEIAGNMTSTAGDIAVLASKLDVEGKITAAGAVGVASGAALEAGAIEANSVTVNADATATVAGNVDVIAGMNVAGTAAVAGNITATLGDVQALGNGSITAADVTAVNVNVEADADLTAADVTAAGNVIVAGEANVDSIDAAGFVSISGKAAVKEAVSTDWSVYVGGELSAASVDAASDVTVALGGKADIEGAVSANNIAVDGTLEAADVTATGYVNVTGKADVAAVKSGWYVFVGGELAADSITAAGSVTVNGTADVTGDIEAESLAVNADASLKVNNVSVDAFAIGGTIEISGNVDANKLTINDTAVINKGFYDIALGGHDVASTVAVEGADAVLTINKAGVETGNIDMKAANSNSVAFNNTDIKVNGKLDFAATANNGLTTWADVTVADGVEFSQSLIANLNGKLTADINSAAYGEEGADVADTLTITGTAAVIEGNINLNEGNDVLVANANFAAGTIDFGTGSDVLNGNANTITADVKSAEELTISSATIVGAVEADTLNIAGYVAVDDEAGVKANAINLGGATLNVYDNIYDAEGNLVDTVRADITAADTLKVTAQGGTINAGTINNAVEFIDSKVTVDADINGNVSFVETEDYAAAAGTSSFSYYGTITGAADLTAVESFGGNNTVTEGVSYTKIAINGGSEITADIAAKAITADDEIEVVVTPETVTMDTYYGWLGTYGPAGKGAFVTPEVTEMVYAERELTLGSNVTINGNITGSKAIDVIKVSLNDSITGTLDFSTSDAKVDGTVGVDRLESIDTLVNVDLAIDKVVFGGKLAIDNVDIVRDFSSVNDQITKAVLESLDGMYDKTALETGYTVEINGKTYGVEFDLINDTLADDDPAKYAPANIKVTISDPDTVTVAGTDADNALAILKDTQIDGSVDLGAGNDILALGGNLTLNVMNAGNVASNFIWNIASGQWEVSGYSASEIAGVKNDFNFGAGDDTLTMADGTALTAGNVFFTNLVINGTETYSAAAEIFTAVLSGTALDIQRNDVTINGDVTAANTVINGNGVVIKGNVTSDIEINGSYVTIIGDILGDVTVNAAGFTIDGSITGDVTLNTAFDASNLDLLAGNLTLNQVVDFTADDPETVADETAAAATAFAQGAINFAKGDWTITNAATVNGTANAAVASVANNSIVGVTGAEEDIIVDEIVVGQQKVTSLTVAGAADIAGADASVNANGVLEIGSVSTLAALTLNGKVAIANATDIDSLNVNGANTITNASGIETITLSENAALTLTNAVAGVKELVAATGAVVNGNFEVADAMSITGKVNGYVEGNSAQQTITLTDANVLQINFAGCASDAVDTLTLASDSAVQSVYFSGYGAITGAGALTGNVSIAGAGALTIGSAVNGTVTGTAGVELIANAAISNATGFASYTGTGSIDTITFEGDATVAVAAANIKGGAGIDTLTLIGGANITSIADVEEIALESLINFNIANGTVAELDLSAITDDALVGASAVFDVAGKFTAVDGFTVDGDNFVKNFTIGAVDYKTTLTWDDANTKYTLATVQL